MGWATSAQLAAQRRPWTQSPESAAAAGPVESGRVGVLEKAIPSEIIVFYTAVISACQAVLKDSPFSQYLEFRLILFLATLLVTGWAKARMMTPLTGSWRKGTQTSEWWTAVVSFAAWGLVLPGSFLYVWLDRDTLAITVATITAGTTLILAVVLTPSLSTTAKHPATAAPASGPPLKPPPSST